LLRRPVPAGFEVLLYLIAPGAVRPYRAEDWRDALVVLERGVVELHGTDGGRLRLAPGAVLFLCGLPLRSLANPGSELALLSGVVRRAAARR